MELKALIMNLEIRISDKLFLRNIVESVTDEEKNCVDLKNFKQKTSETLDRDYSSIRKRMKKIINIIPEEKIEEMFGIKKEGLSSKVFIQKITDKINE